MKRPDFSELKKLVSKMGAENVNWKSDGSIIRRERAQFIKELESTGREVDFNEIKIHDGGLLSLNGEQIVIYIKDNTYNGQNHWNSFMDENYDDNITNDLDPFGLRRVHLKDCSKIREMRSIGRWNRYIASQRKTGSFLIDTRHSQDVEAELIVCRFCLGELNYNNYSNEYRMRDDIVEAFNIAEFFETHESRFQFIPSHDEYTAPSSTYTDDWSLVSERYKESEDWTCEKCRVDLNDYRKLLHTHHKNGVRSDNSPSNLEALCASCHRKEPNHAHMSDKNDETIERLREEQGLS